MMTAKQRAYSLVVQLGWDWGDCLNELKDVSEEVLFEFIDVLDVEPTPDEPEPITVRSLIGLRAARRELYVRHGWTPTYWCGEFE